MSSLRDERRRQKPADSGTAAPAKQVKPVGVEQSAEPSPARDMGKIRRGSVGSGVQEREPADCAEASREE